MEIMDTLNGEVTQAIMEADDLTFRAYKAWKRVAAAEEALVKALDRFQPDGPLGSADDVERSIADRGAASAHLKARVIRAFVREKWLTEDEFA